MQDKPPQTPSLAAVNALFLVCFVLALTAGSVLQAWSTGWGLILTEVLLILLPGLIFLRRKDLAPLAATGARWPGWQIAAWSLLAGLGLAPFAQWLSKLVIELLGYTLGLPPEFFPRTWPEGLLLFIGLAVFAPLCEEFFFRGVIQRQYLRLGPTAAILWTAALFLMFHFSLQRGLILFPAALALGYVAWRSDSLVASVLLHAGYNLPAALLTVVASINPAIALDWSANPSLAAAGLLLAVGSLWALRMRTRPEVISPAPPEGFKPGALAAQIIPLALAVPIFGIVAGAEVVVGRYPQIIAQERLRFEAPAWQGGESWRYELRNAAEQPVGDATCSLALQGVDFTLDCRLHQLAFELQIPGSYYQTGAYEQRLRAAWHALDLQPVAYTRSRVGEGLDNTLELVQPGRGAQLAIQQGGERQSLALPEDVLLPDEWAWRFSALEFGLSNAFRAELAHPSKWDPEAGVSAPQVEAITVVVVTGEPLAVPAGNYLAWKVQVGRASAWYDVAPPHTLLRYDDGFVSWRLAEE